MALTLAVCCAGDLLHITALPKAAPPNWPDVEAPPIVRLGKCQGETKREAQSSVNRRHQSIAQ